MKALVYKGAWEIGISDVPVPKVVNPHDVLVRIRTSTICGTDIGIVSGLYEAKENVILGHEASGDIVEVGSGVTNLAIGERVAIDPTYYCGRCWMCLNGSPNHCEQKLTTETGVSSNGTFTDYYVTEDRMLYKLPDHVSYEEACLTEPLSCVLTGTNQLRLRTNLDTAVAGGGPIGMLYCHSLGLHGLSGALVEVSKSRQVLCDTLLPENWITCESLQEAAAKLGTRTGAFDLVVDACGGITKEALSRLNRRGQLLLVGLRRQSVDFDPMQIADRSQSLIGSIDSIHTFQESLNLIITGKIPVKRMVSARFGIADYLAAFASLGCSIEKRDRSNTATAMKVALTS
ncbi:MAG TPA: alcohol dehydrogenase catalytic domain-containing protein [Candidatus Peribacteraceae bacterium]|nr:alcohol dehydrogenase catalytic domain-containing protein [Candidatus Peribacteraceae bacterium]